MATITNGQLEINGVLVVGDNTNYRLPADFVQWWAAPEVRTSDVARSGANGYVAGRDLLGKHVTHLTVLIIGNSESELGDRIETWKAACASTPDTLVALRSNLLGRTRVRFGRWRIPGDVTVDQWTRDYGDLDPSRCAVARAYGHAQFEALDALTYGDVVHSLTTARTVSGTGFTPPFTVPFTLGAAVAGAMTITNAGSAPAPWTGRLDGPLTYPEISHAESGRRLSLAFTANGGIDLAAGQWIDLDSTHRSVLLNGVADRRTQLTVDSEWWQLDPGDNTFQLDADAGTGTLTVTWRDGYYS